MIQNNRQKVAAKGKGTSNIKDKNTSALHQASIAKLRKALKGRLILPDDAQYDRARTVYFGGIDRRPAMIIQAADAEDVARAVTLAAESGMELAVRSGGHSAAGHSVCEGGIVLDLRNMKTLRIDPKKHTAWVETGLTAGEYTTAADAYNLATGFGDTGSVGIGGLTLGGGIGYLSRKHGLTVDNLQAAKLVTADGQQLHVDGENHPDLYWAIRGGGGNFGVATRFQFKLHEVGKVLGGMLLLPATPEVITNFITEAESAPEELSTIANIMPAPPMPFLPAEHHGKLILMGMMVYAGNIEEGMGAVAPFRKMAQPLADMLRPMHYPEMFPGEEGEYHPLALGRPMFIDGVDHEAARAMIEYLQASDAPMRVAQLRVMGGAISRVLNEATAFAHRHRRIMVNLATFYTSPEDKEKRLSWLADFASALHQNEPGAYVNFLGDESEEQVRAAYPGSTWERLSEIKARYDPTNLFRINHNIRPKTTPKKAK